MQKLPDNYTTPTTTEHAYSFGIRAGMIGAPRVSHAEFFSAPCARHPFPGSLYRAYRRGYAEGRKVRAHGMEKTA